MNTDTMNKMKQMKFYGMLRSFKASLEADREETLTTDELIAQLSSSMQNGMSVRTGASI